MRLTDKHLERRDIACDKFRDATERYNAAVRANTDALGAAYAEICKAWEDFNRAVISLRVTAHLIGDDLDGPMQKMWRRFDADPPPFPLAPGRVEFATDATMGGFEELPTADDGEDDSESDE